ncbi:hypothetical protein DFJ58DRAFT_765118 [Suillus subalutaceus]|uniref:uncharacterized protein n=1 Tax=Suillus subalutaceus TaxID=48586 RepID=UPI001B8601E6|nr:uncharacterized protein DFJ58DRAFT_765118 [Suillus subalutaceus]KAG1870200.1 hypothetical protein DFJ58DRAFT_765118 [Suillus subalutaceus]
MAAVLRTPATQSTVLTAQHMPPSSTSRASNSSCSHTHSATGSVPMRRIRFAPLPEPTAQDDNSKKNDIMDTHSRTHPPLSSNTVNVQRSAPSDPKPKPSLSRQFNLFKRSSIDPTPHHPQPYDFGAPLSQSASIPSNDSQPRYLSTAPSSSSSQTRSSTNSLASGGDHHAMPQNHFPSTSPSHPTSPPTHPKVPTTGRHMLNGRVYRSKRQPLTNLSANVHDEPEFVEWGYGGMGSVNCSGDSKYSVLAKGTPALLSHGHVQKVVVGGGHDDAARQRKDGVGASDPAGGDGDDWSGMAWVRKRRQERERLARGNTC